MSRKLKVASAISLAATLIVTLVIDDGSRALAGVAEYEAPADTQAVSAVASTEAAVAAETEAAPVFVSEPVVQPLPEPAPEPETAFAGASGVYDTLAELVAEHDVPAELDSELRCLAGAIYFESKGESLAGQLAVGRVVVARAESSRFPSTYCGVVYQRSQFSFVRGGKMPQINTSSRAWTRAKKLALIAHNDAWESQAEGALFFHAKYVAPRWRNKMSRLASIDNHIFYR